jgi:septum formation protein
MNLSIQRENLFGKRSMESETKKSLILASNSPRRKELLGWADIPFTIMGSNVDEFSSHRDPHAYAIEIAFQKSEAIWSRLEKREDFGSSFSPFVVASDTVVELQGKFFGKPKDKNDAREMLNQLSDKQHRVVTSVVFQSLENGQKKSHSFSIETLVTFSEIPKDIMDPYLESGESLDKAGSYGIQGKGLLFVKSISGSYSNVVGFPLEDFVRELKNYLIPRGDQSCWREHFVL